jgi:hypothetical protein
MLKNGSNQSVNSESDHQQNRFQIWCQNDLSGRVMFVKLNVAIVLFILGPMV